MNNMLITSRANKLAAYRYSRAHWLEICRLYRAARKENPGLNAPPFRIYYNAVQAMITLRKVLL